MFSDEELPEEGDRIKLNKLLKDAVFDQNYKRTYFYLKKGADATLRVNIDAGNLLHHTKDSRIAALLIRNGARVDARNRFRLTPLYLAVKEGNFKLVKLLLKQGADVHCFDKRHLNTPLNVAVIAGDFKLVKLLLEYGSVVNDQTNCFSNSPLHLAISLRYINVKVIDLLFEKEADVNILNCWREGPIHLAVKNSHCPLHVIKKLLKLGALVNTKDSKGYFPLNYALNDDNYELTKLLLKHGAEIKYLDGIGYNAFHNYIFRIPAKLKIVKCLLKHGCNSNEVCYTNASNSEGVSPLTMVLYRISCIDLRIIKVLLHYNASPFLTTETGQSTMFEKTLLLVDQPEAEALKIGETVETFRKNKERSVQVMKWLIKYSAIKSNDQVSLMQTKLKDKDYFCNFLNECLVELPLVEQELGISLNELLNPASKKDLLPNCIVDKIIHMLTIDSFPIYKEVVEAALKRSDLLNRFKYEILCINTEKGQTYFLNWTITCHLVKYLCTEDLLFLFVAFFTQSQK